VATTLNAETSKRASIRGGLGAAAVVVSGVALDQLTKLWATRELMGRPFQQVIPGYFELRYSLNRGAFFSFGADLPSSVRQAFFVGMSLLVCLLIVRLLRKLPPAHRAARWALVLLLTGAIGNLIDRVRSGEVVDFLHLHLRDVFHWATFNVADMYIAGGLCLLILDLLRPQTARARGSEPSPHTP